MLAARLGFSLPRDVAKGACALRELVATGYLLGEPPGRTRFSVLDVGAGLGAMTWGLVHELSRISREAGAATFSVEASLADTDPEAVALALDIARQVSLPGVRLEARAIRVDAARSLPPRAVLGDFDLVLVGQVLSELDVDADCGSRAARHVTLLADLLARVRPGGALVVVEPALRDRTRHLHAVRDALAAQGHPPFAPCLHAGACPILQTPDGWCHEDRAVDLPTWLVPVARAAGLRWQGLTFSYLVLTPEGASMASRFGDATGLLRVVSQRLATKGKEELIACGALPDTPHAVRLRRLDRARSDPNRAWDELQRGDCFTIDAEGAGARREIGRATGVRVCAPVDEHARDRYLEGP